MRPRIFKPGKITKDVWIGDIVSECEYIRPLGRGVHLFYDRTFECFRRAFWDVVWNIGSHPKPTLILNGCETRATPFTS